MTQKETEFHAYDLFVAVIAVVSMVLISVWFFLDPGSQVRGLIDRLDLAFCAIFFFDFCRSLVISTDRWRYLRTWGWFDFLSSLPAIAHFRYFRVLRILRIIRVIRSARILVQVVQRDRAAASIAGFFLLWTLTFVAICVAILVLERNAPGTTMDNADDVLWWAVVTSSTVGYGDVYPVTDAGRLLGGVMMVLGIGTFATVTSGIGLWFARMQNRRKDTVGAPSRTISMGDLDDRLSRIEELLRRDKEDR